MNIEAARVAVQHGREGIYGIGLAVAAEQLLAEVEQLGSVLAEVRDLHGHPRTARHGSGCVSCGIVWPCPTYRAISSAGPAPTVDRQEGHGR